ncbi:hypothetical protein GQ457_15G015120 [Hibiscus cannabinus]
MIKTTHFSTLKHYGPYGMRIPGGRPPDLVEIVGMSHIEDHSSLSVSPGLKPLQKRGCGTDLGPSDADDMEMVAAEDGVDEERYLVGIRWRARSEKRCELDVEVREEDVRVGVIIRLLGKSIGYKALLNRIQSLWNPVGGMSLIDLDNDYYLVRFALTKDFNKVLTGGPWVICGSYLTIMVWVCLPKLPYRYYTKSLSRHISSSIGKGVKVDYNTTKGRRGRFARLAIIVDLNKPLKSGIIIGGQRQDIEYEGFPTICYKCGKIGHSIDICGKHRPGEGAKMESSKPRDPIELYGPWMQVVHRRRRQGTAKAKPDQVEDDRMTLQDTGSRFFILDEDAYTEEEGVKSVSGRVHASRAVAKNVSSEPNAKRIVEHPGVDKALKSVAAPEKVLPAKSSLTGDKHSAGKVLPSSIVGLQIMESSKIGVGKLSGLKPGNKPKKRVYTSLVADLDRAADEVKGHGVTDHKCDPSDTDGGALDPEFNRSFKLLINNKKPDMVAIFEPQISGVATDNFIHRLGFECLYRVEAQGFSGGIWILWRESPHFDVLVVSSQYVHGLDVGKCRSLWDQLRVLEPDDGKPWLVGGDLNVIGSAVERRGGSSRRVGVCQLFCDFMFYSGLLDMGFSGLQFTWRRGNLFQRLDRFICNKAWYEWFPTSEIFHLLNQKPFRYIVAWNDHEGFREMLSNSWSLEKPFYDNVSKFQEASRKWNVDVFGHIGRCKANLLAQESLWFQKARSVWIDKGDQNTRFFHMSVIARRRRNTIRMLRINGHWCKEPEQLQQHAIEFFRELFTSDRGEPGIVDITGEFQRLAEYELRPLTARTVYTIPPSLVAEFADEDRRRWEEYGRIATDIGQCSRRVDHGG